jgi:hypothetical protein
MITNRTLTTWRREALKIHKDLEHFECAAEFTQQRRQLVERIIRLTQELQDINLLKVIK